MARRDVLVLCYHGVAPESLHGEVTPDALRAQLSLLADRGYRWATFTDAVTGDEPGRVASVTFDDGIASAVEHVHRPVLERVCGIDVYSEPAPRVRAVAIRVDRSGPTWSTSPATRSGLRSRNRHRSRCRS